MLFVAQKTSQVLLHMSVAFGVTYAFTGSLATGGLAAILEPVCNVLLLPLHDRVWTKLRALPYAAAYPRFFRSAFANSSGTMGRPK